MKKLSMLAVFALAAAVGATTACDKPAEPAPAPAPAPAAAPAPAPTPAPAPAAEPVAAAAGGDAAAEALNIFNTRCAACHGASGKGDGMAAAALNPKPRDYSDKEWQKSVDDNYIAKVIVEGGAAVGKSPLMTPNADLKDKPEVVAELVKKVRSFAQ